MMRAISRCPVHFSFIFLLTQLTACSCVRAQVSYAYVGSDGPDAYASIQAAVDAAPDNSYARHTIVIPPGEYHERVVIPASKRRLTLRGADPANTIISDGAYASQLDPDGRQLGTFGTPHRHGPGRRLPCRRPHVRQLRRPCRAGPCPHRHGRSRRLSQLRLHRLAGYAAHRNRPPLLRELPHRRRQPTSSSAVRSVGSRTARSSASATVTSPPPPPPPINPSATSSIVARSPAPTTTFAPTSAAPGAMPPPPFS